MSLKRILLQADPFERKAAALAPRTPGAPLTPVFDTWPKNGAWSKNNNLGYAIKFAPDANNRQTILKMPEWGFPKVWTIQLGISPLRIADTNDFNGRNIVAIIEVGVGGSIQTYRIDWVEGAQISVVCNAINVVAEYAGIDVGDEGDFELSVQCSPYPRPSSYPPRSTLVVSPFSSVGYPSGTICEALPIAGAGGSTGLMTIPPFATRICVCSALASTSSIAQFYSDTTLVSLESGTGPGTIATVAVRGSDLRFQQGLPVTGSALFARVDNLHATEPIFVTCYAEIAG